MAHQLVPSGRFCFHSAELYEDQQIGAGSYGVVCKAKCDEVPCAAKILRPVFFQDGDPGAQLLIERFENECVLLSGIKHPHIVQYLGMYRNQSGLPVLLMEILDQSLTAFLERSSSALSHHTQFNLCHDIALALVYLHLNGIIHRDLSSNNVLLTAGLRAKVTDFGMAKLMQDVFRQPAENQTQCPGCLVYMPPQALVSPPEYTEKLDIFSFGVLTIQIITREFPNPGPPRREVMDEKYGPVPVQVPIPEKERRKAHIDRVDPSHPLLNIAVCCLEYNENERPSSQDLCHQLVAIKATVTPPPKALENSEKTEELKKVQKELEVVQGDLKAAQDELQTAQKEVVRLNSEVEHQAEIIEELRSKSPPSPSSEGERRLVWGSYSKAPCRMFRGAAATAGNTIYINPSGTKEVYEFNTDNNTWNSMPDCAHSDFGLAYVNSLVTTVGGDKSQSEPTNILLSLVRGNRWSQHFPPMRIKRFEPAVACSNHLLVVAGGKTELGGGRLCTVEVMDTVTRHWYLAASLPIAVSGMSMTIAGERIHLLGGFDERGASTTVFSCTLSALRSSFRSRSLRKVFRQGFSRGSRNIWQVNEDIPVYYSTCASLDKDLISVGGLDSHRRPTAEIRKYNPSSNSWHVVGAMPTARYDCLVSVTCGNKLVVVGGCTSSSWGSWTDVVEVCTL